MNHNGHPTRALTVLALVMVFALPLVAHASDYTGGKIDYTWRIFGDTRSYTHNTMNISLTCNTTNGSTGTHTVKLFRDRVWPASDDFIGSKSIPRRGTGQATWPGTGAGRYYFNFEKAQDGVRVYSNNVRMWCN